MRSSRGVARNIRRSEAEMMDSITEQPALTDRRCEECDLYMHIEDRTIGGAITLYRCPLGHMLFVGAFGQVVK